MKKKISIAILALCAGTVAVAQNTSYGSGALSVNSGYGDSGFGQNALFSNSTGGYNTATGMNALSSNTSGFDNTANGPNTLYSNTTGNYNTAVGPWALYYNTGSYNEALGFAALLGVTTGSSNIGIGTWAGGQISSGSNNIEIGNPGTSNDNGAVRIGQAGSQTSFFAAGINGVQVSGVPVYIDGNGQLGTVNSSIRFKEDVHDMGDASSAIFRLRPVTYRYKQAYADGSKPIDYGLIAEEVAKIYPDMVVKGADGQIQTVQYQKLTPMLLNELQKQHQLLEQQQQTIAQQGNAIQMLEKRLGALEAAQNSNGPELPHAAE